MNFQALGLILFLCFIFSVLYFPKHILVKPFSNADQWQQSQQFFIKNSQLTTSATVFHLQDSQCWCSFFSKKHIELLDQQASRESVDVVVIDVRQSELSVYHQGLIKQVPSLPAVMMLDAEGNWRYVGPYSEGLTCSIGNSFVETLLATLNSPTSSNVWLNFFSEGCFCENPLFNPN